MRWQALMGFSRPEYWRGQPFPSPGDLPNPGIEPRSPTLQAASLLAEPQGKPKNSGVGSLSFLQQIFQIRKSNQGLLHCRRILYQLCYQGSPNNISVQFSSVTQSRLIFVTLWTAARQASVSITNSWSLLSSCPSSRWCHPTISSSVIPFSSHLQSFPASGSFQMSQFFASGGQSIEISASASVLPTNIQDWFRKSVGSPCSPKDSQESSSTPQFKSIDSSTFSFLYSPTLTSIHDYWKNHSFD